MYLKRMSYFTVNTTYDMIK